MGKVRNAHFLDGFYWKMVCLQKCLGPISYADVFLPIAVKLAIEETIYWSHRIAQKKTLYLFDDLNFKIL